MESPNRASMRAMRARYPARRLPVVEFRQDAPEMPEGAEECPDCGGDGIECTKKPYGTDCDTCATCNGKGWVLP